MHAITMQECARRQSVRADLVGVSKLLLMGYTYQEKLFYCLPDGIAFARHELGDYLTHH